jgi:hypothetical protein
MVDLEEDLERSRLRGVEARAPGGTKKPVLTADHHGWLDTRPSKRGKPTAQAIGGHWRRGVIPVSGDHDEFANTISNGTEGRRKPR